MKIQILVAVYNGEKYLREQLDSIAAQTAFSDISVLIRDDKSTDSSPEILREYAQKYGFKVIFGKKNLNVNKSMWELVSAADAKADLFAFCDQDDVWLKNKIANAAEMLKDKNPEAPVLYAAKSRLVDEQLQVIGDMPEPHLPCGFFNAVIQNIFPGHAMVFNRALLTLLQKSDISDAKMYDWWTYITASAYGEIVYDKRVGTFYRQHGDNAVGFQLGGLALFRQRLSRMNKKGKNAISVQANSFYEQNEDVLPAEYKSELEKFLTADGFFARLGYVPKTRFYRQTPNETLIFKLLYVLGKYKF